MRIDAHRAGSASSRRLPATPESVHETVDGPCPEGKFLGSVANLRTLPERSRMHKSFKRIGLVGFLLFLAKGLAWLSIPVLTAARGCSS
jgi:hypothetical protein